MFETRFTSGPSRREEHYRGIRFDTLSVSGATCFEGVSNIVCTSDPLPRTRREVLQGLGTIAVGTLLGGCGGSGSGSSGGAALQMQPVPAGPMTASTLSVSDSQVGSIGPAFAGLSYEKSSMGVARFTPDNTNLIGLFKRLGTSSLRIGGNSVDQTLWVPGGAGRTGGQVAPSDIDALAGFLKATGWSVLYGVNLATSTASAAADEVTHAAQALGDSLYGIEIGNEPDLYGGHYFQSWSLQAFEQRWEEFRNAILQAAAHVVLTGPATAGSIGTWAVPFGQYVGSQQIAVLTHHYYRGDGQSPSSTVAQLVSPDAALRRALSQLQQGAAQINVPYRLAETNSFFSGGAPGVSDTYASALWVVDHLFNIALGGGAGANLHGGGNGNGYTPIADENGSVVEARPEYYGILLFTLVGTGALLNATLSAAGLNATAYAVRASDGSLRLVVVNKDTTQNLSLNIDCGRAVTSASLIAMTGPTLTATSNVLIQGGSVAADGSFQPEAAYDLSVSGNHVSCYVGALSAVMIQVS